MRSVYLRADSMRFASRCSESGIRNQRFTSEFKDEAVEQITERGYAVSEVAERLVCRRTASTSGRGRLSPTKLSSTRRSCKRLVKHSITHILRS